MNGGKAVALGAMGLAMLSASLFGRRAGPEGFEEARATLTLYHAKWCPHCVAFKPEWDAMKGELEKRGVRAVEWEATTAEGSRMAAAAGVTGYPTMRLSAGGKETTVPGSMRDRKSVLAFVDGEVGGRGR